ncbi:hypothetical protein [Cupriavidus sp. BIC8F]|uniref:hypothetical protein n=1 Tax=Cupriavidus sp. BIC8F TaxID=3079014 RepID=UPI0029167423|nr:hypothetical protein [Cupriavidus sp. BIC8F]
MARKKTHLEMKGGKSPRQRVWEAIRLKRERFTQEEIAEVVGGLELNVSQYCRCLVAAEIIEVIAEERVGKLGMRKTYRLLRDNGVEAPRVTRDGALVVKGAGNEAMWGTIRRMFERKDFSCRELAAFASTAAHRVSESTATKYVRALFAAGYLTQTCEAIGGRAKQKARYMLKAGKYSGPRAPIVQRPTAVYDPNQNRIVWIDMKEFEDAQ